MSNIMKVVPQKNQTKAAAESKSESATTQPAAVNEAAKDETGPSTSSQVGAQQQKKPEQQQQQEQRGVSSSSGNVSAAPMTQLANQLNGSLMRIKRELSDIMQHPPPNCSAEMYKEDHFHWKATVNGPSGTVYEGGIFKLDIRFPAAYPFRPPQIRFMTRIYHCNVDGRGVICLDVLNERWSPVMNIAKILLSIWVLIGECNPNDPLVMGIADQYKSNRKEHDKIARYWTKRFAMPKPKSKEEVEKDKDNDKEQEQEGEKEGDNEQEREQEQEQEQEQQEESLEQQQESLEQPQQEKKLEQQEEHEQEAGASAQH